MYLGLPSLGLRAGGGLGTLAAAVRALFSNPATPGVHFQTYDPDTILARRNLLTYSQDFDNAIWSKVRATITPNAAIAPDGSMTASKLVEDVTTGDHVARALHSVVAGSWYSGSIYLKAAERTSVMLFENIEGGTQSFIFNLTTGAVTSNTTPRVPVVTDAGNGWWRVSISLLADTTTSSGLAGLYVVLFNGSVSYAGNGVSGCYLWGGQFEKAAAPTTYQKVTDWNTEFLSAGADRVTMFQDSICTTPVTKVEDPIGGFISSERGTARGPELRGTGATAIVGVASPATYNTATGAGTVNRVDLNNQSYVTIPVTAGTNYVITLTNTGANIVAVRENGTGLILHNVAAGVKQQIVVKSATAIIGFASGAADASFTIHSIAALPGKVATQPTGGFRPKLDARVNQLLSSERFDDPVWSKGSAPTVTANTHTAPDGTLTADTITSIGGTPSVTQAVVATATAVVYSIYARTGGTKPAYNFLLRNGTTLTNFDSVVFDSVTGAIAGPGWTSESVGGGWFRLAYARSAGISVGDSLIAYAGATGGVSAAGESWIVWGADLRTAADAALDIPAYQRVNTATDYDYTGFPMRARGDGADDFLSLPLDLSTTDKVTAWMAGNVKASDATIGALAELTASASANAGSFGMYSPWIAATANYGARSAGTTFSTASSPATHPAPSNGVLCLTTDIAADTLTLDVDGVLAATGGADQGAGNYANSTLYILSRAGISLFSNAGFTSLTVLGRTASTGERSIINSFSAKYAKI